MVTLWKYKQLKNSNRAGINSINGRYFVLTSRVYKQHPSPCLETKCQTGIPPRSAQQFSHVAQAPFLDNVDGGPTLYQHWVNVSCEQRLDYSSLMQSKHCAG